MNILDYLVLICLTGQIVITYYLITLFSTPEFKYHQSKLVLLFFFSGISVLIVLILLTIRLIDFLI
jgi:hypothetical protein